MFEIQFDAVERREGDGFEDGGGITAFGGFVVGEGIVEDKANSS